jgi:hypothetical protein
LGSDFETNHQEPIAMDKQTSADDVARELKEIGAEISQKYYGQMRYWAAGNSLPWE